MGPIQAPEYGHPLEFYLFPKEHETVSELLPGWFFEVVPESSVLLEGLLVFQPKIENMAELPLLVGRDFEVEIL